jgi:hypothetical protein
MPSRDSLVVVVFSHLLVFSTRTATGEDKPRPRWELKDKPSMWESSWRNCEDGVGSSSGADSGGGGGGVSSGGVDSVFTVHDVVASPGSFAGRTGHSGSTKFTVDTNGKRLEEASARESHTRKTFLPFFISHGIDVRFLLPPPAPKS